MDKRLGDPYAIKPHLLGVLNDLVCLVAIVDLDVCGNSACVCAWLRLRFFNTVALAKRFSLILTPMPCGAHFFKVRRSDFRHNRAVTVLLIVFV